MIHPSKLPDLSLRQLYRYLARYVRYSPASTRAIPPANKIRVPTEPGVGVFFYPVDSWRKRVAFSVGPLGETHALIHPSKFQITRPITAVNGDVNEDGKSTEGTALPPEILYWGEGGSVRVTKNLLSGVTEGFAVTLELHGVGFRVEADEKRNVAIFRLGFSHTIEVPLTSNEVFLNVINPQLLQVAGINREKVHQLAAKVRALRPPEPYKGKGIRYKNEPVRRKAARKD